MARARNIKPGFFTHEQMAENDPLGRLLFIGLTTIADYKGDIEWRPKRIKVQLLPYDECSTEQLAINLDKSGFVRFYSDGEKIYLHVVNFEKHQNPHKNERESGSEIPAYTEEMRQAIDLKTLTIKSGKIAINPEQDGTAPADSLIPYPYSLNPDSPILIPEKPTCAEPQSASPPVVVEHPVISIPRNDNSNHPITQSQIDRWSALYPAVDVLQELRAMVGWSDANRSKRKTKSGMDRFVNAWLSKAQNTPARHGAQHERTPQSGHQPINWDDTSWGDNLDAALDIG